jgi:hypothetical protein
MSLREERLKILDMIQSGHISAEEGAQLLAALKASQQKEASASTGSSPRWFRLRVTDMRTGKQKVSMNIPMSLVNVGMKMGARFVPDSEAIDYDEIAHALRHGQQGKILEVEDEDDQERVEIFFE